MPTWVLVAVLLSSGVATAVEADPSPAAVVDMILAAPDAARATASLQRRYGWTPRQAEAVLGLDLAAIATLDAADLAALVAAAGGRGDQRLIDLATKRLSAGGGMLLPAADQAQSGRLDGGVRFELDRVVIASGRIDFTLADLPGGGPFLATADLVAAEGERVLVDTSRSRFESLDFRGRLEPGSIRVERLPVAADSAAVAFRMRLDDLATFSGLLRDDGGAWLPVSGEGQRMEIDLAADLVDGRAADPRVTRIAILGAPGRLELVEPRQTLRVRSSEIELRFAPGGGLAAIETGRDSEVVGQPHAVDALPHDEAE